MNYLLDTHALLWLLDDELAIPAPVLIHLKNPANNVYVSVASIWEIAIKRSLNKLTLDQPTQAIVDELPNLLITLQPILASHVLQVEMLPMHHRDPFDRLIIAQASVENWTIISKDPNFPLYPVDIFWN